MSGSMPDSDLQIIVPAAPSFNLDILVSEAIQCQDNHLFDSGDESPLPLLTPSPELVPSVIDTPPPSICLNYFHEYCTSLTSSDSNSKKDRPSIQQKKKTTKITSAKRQTRKNAAANASRRARRKRKLEEVDAHYEARPSARIKHIGVAMPILSKIDAHRIPVATGAYIGINKRSTDRNAYRLDEAVGVASILKFKLQKWDGRKPAAIVDQFNRIITILAGHPDDPTWKTMQAEAADALERRRPRCVSTGGKGTADRRGEFVALACGVSHGGGQTVPSNLHNKPPNQQVLTELNAMEPFIRLAGFASSVLATWAPKLSESYRANINDIHSYYPRLKRIFPASIFSAVTYNFGPQTVCYEHKDGGNKATGMCAVTPFGDFDYTKGGHLILWELELVVEFPPGSTILLPSALISHSNVDIAEHERRYSFAQYTAGGLFRWVDQGFQTQAERLASLSPKELAAEDERLAKRLESELSLIPVVTKKSSP